MKIRTAVLSVMLIIFCRYINERTGLSRRRGQRQEARESLVVEL